VTSEAERRAEILAVVLGAPAGIDVRWRVHAIQTFEPGVHLDEGDLIEVIERARLPISPRRACRSLIAAGLAEERDGGLVLRDQIDLGALADRFSAEERSVEVAELQRWLGAIEGVAEARQLPGMELSALVDAVARSARWAAQLSQTARAAGLAGLPVFWEEIEADDGGRAYRSSTDDVGSISTTDGLIMVVRGLRLDPDDPVLQSELVHLVESMAAMQRTTPGWEVGALVTPMWDDDFVGTFQASTAELGPCPTLDATACLAIAVSEALGTSASSSLSHVTAQLDAALELVLRWQAPDGSWAIHRYDPSGPAWPMPARTLSVRYAVDALHRARAHTSLDYGAAPAQALAFLREHARHDDGQVRWALDFALQPRSDLGATATLLPAVIALGQLCDDDVSDLVDGAVDFLRSTWVPGENAYLEVPFRVPTWEGPALERFSWEVPLDPIVLSALCASPASWSRLDLEDRARVALATSAALDQCRPGGYWIDLLLAEGGTIQGMTGNSDFFQTAIADVLRFQRAGYLDLPDLT
jgi:hypothetical protein